jgi:hypothetical protein
MTPTRADLERLIETWREKSRQYALGYVTDGCDPDDLRPGYASEVIECANELAALLTSEGPAPTCAWREDEHDATWHTECGQMWQFNDGGPTENKQRFCGYCGSALVGVPFVYADESEPAEGPETPADTPEGR